MKRRGFTLIESLVSLSIASIFLLMAGSLMPSSAMAECRAGHRNLACQWAQSVLQQELSRGDLAAGPARDLAPRRQNGADFRTRVQVVHVAGGGRRRDGRRDHSLEEVRVTVRWEELGRPATMELNGRICQ